MLGWMIVFALMAILGTVLTLANPAAVSAVVGLMFALLFLLGLLTWLVRGRAW
jgi:energy-converting hydrogenase Eha subunit F